MDSGFLERMNTLLVNGEGKEGAQRQGPMLDTNEKRSGLEEEQLHINVGLDKITETMAQVEEVQKQTPQSKKAEAMKDLDRVEPDVIDAQNVTKSIKKQHLGKGRSMANMACGPAGKGTIAQLEYAGRPSRDNPLRQELRALVRPQTSRRKRRAGCTSRSTPSRSLVQGGGEGQAPAEAEGREVVVLEEPPYQRRPQGSCREEPLDRGHPPGSHREEQGLQCGSTEA